ncbi:sugar transferase [Ornithinimicrobium cerasi]|uniref:sugar transferase n=1 Tax=Ornithinimicrobium cerasi TaxID=2248773 RepID=UPI00137B304A|nr:sugar transferase [Ornithinimicrobium cerasi]
MRATRSGVHAFRRAGSDLPFPSPAGVAPAFPPAAAARLGGASTPFPASGVVDTLAASAHRAPATRYPEVASQAKRLMDVTGGLILLVIFVLALPVLATLVKLDSRGPVFHTQVRVGLHGRPFRMYKLRSMVAGAELDGLARWTYCGDPRVTRLGRILRASHLDEMPQAINILRGDMSLVGPRPERPELVQVLSEQFVHFPLRHSVRPGLTGLAQVRHCYTSSVADWHDKLAYDLDYVRRASLVTDLRILFATVVEVVRLKGM